MKNKIYFTILAAMIIIMLSIVFIGITKDNMISENLFNNYIENSWLGEV